MGSPIFLIRTPTIYTPIYKELYSMHPEAQNHDLDLALHTLGWSAFQDFSAMVIATAFDQPIEIFNKTRDGGRDGGFFLRNADSRRGLVAGSVTLQCKHTSNQSVSLTASLLEDEKEKARRLASNGQATNYILVTNMKLTGINLESVDAQFRNIKGIKTFHCFGREWITEEVRKSKELRQFIPRIYGLGDLSSILDERAYEQSRAIFARLKDDIKTFVVTDAYVAAAAALKRHGFVLLLGDPGSGKSMIAATHAIAAVDLEAKPTLKIRNAQDFIQHWNPLSPNQFFWVDDAFGATQFDETATQEWAAILYELRTAIQAGAKILFTSRTYIFRDAERYLKASELPQMFHSQVIIELAKLTDPEKQQIIYNHLRLGTQDRSFKSRIKHYLHAAVQSQYFLPETARRLGSPFFTKTIALTREGINDFFNRPIDYLEETITCLDLYSTRALYLLFMHGGSLTIPLSDTPGIDASLKSLSLDPIIAAMKLEALSGLLVSHDGAGSWTFRHPTVRDTIATIVGKAPGLIDIYLRGTPIERAVVEIRCEGKTIPGSTVVLPSRRYDDFAMALHKLPQGSVIRFLARRADDVFIKSYCCQFHESFGAIKHAAESDPLSLAGELMTTLARCEMLSTDERSRFSERLIEECLLSISSDIISRECFKTFLGTDEVQEFAEKVKAEILTRIRDIIYERSEDFSSQNDDPDSFFDDLKDALEDFRALYEDEDSALLLIDEALARVYGAEERLREKMPPEPDYDPDLWRGKGAVARDIFDDVDE